MYRKEVLTTKGCDIGVQMFTAVPIKQLTLLLYKAIFIYVTFHEFEMCNFGIILSIKGFAFAFFKPALLRVLHLVFA